MFTQLFNPFATEVSLASTPFLFITRLMLIKIYVLCIGFQLHYVRFVHVCTQPGGYQSVGARCSVVQFAIE